MFRTEIELVNLLKENLEQKFKKRNIEIFQEVSLGFGIADIVVSVVKDSKPDTSMDINKLDELEIHTYTLLENEGTLSFSTMMDITRVEKYQLFKSISLLIDKGFVKESPQGYQVCKTFDLVFKSNYAIEAKLKNWRRALHQAYRYRWFAEYAYVVMDQHHCKPAIAHKDLFMKYNVGLAAIDLSGQLKRYYHPVRQKPFDLKMQRLFSENIKRELAYVT